MTRLINAVLISLFAFFVFLGVYLQFSGNGAQGGTAAGLPTVTALEAQWQPDAEREILMDLHVHNPSNLEGRVTSISYIVEIDGRVADRAIARPFVPPIVVPARFDVPVQVELDLPDDFILSWWPAYLAGGETADLRIQGALAMRREDAGRDAPFEWRSSWEGGFLEQLSTAATNCSPSEADLCLAEGSFTWKDGALQAELVLDNPGPESASVRNMSVQVLMDGRVVLAGAPGGPATVPAGNQTGVAVVLPLSETALTAWWPGHLERCERTQVAILMDLEVHGNATDDEPGRVSTLEWTFPASTFQTRFLCAP